MSLTLDEYIILLWFNYARTFPGTFGWRTVKMLIGSCVQSTAEAIYCRYLQILAKYTAGYRYIPPTPGSRSGINKVLTNDEWFVMLALGGQDSGADLLQKLALDIGMCETLFARYLDIFGRYEKGWRAAADPVTSPNGQ